MHLKDLEAKEKKKEYLSFIYKLIFMICNKFYFKVKIILNYLN